MMDMKKEVLADLVFQKCMELHQTKPFIIMENNVVFAMKQSDEVFNVWGLARATHGYVADGYHRHVKGTALQDSKIEERVSYSNSLTVKP